MLNARYNPILAVVGAAFLLTLAACGPSATVTPQESDELVTAMPFDEAYSEVVTAINLQPYPEDSSGWVITNSDQVGGFIAAENSVRRCGFLGFGCDQYLARVSVTLVRQAEDRTSVTISLNGDPEAEKLVANIRDRLGI